MNIFKNLYKYREFLKTSVKKEFRGKYLHIRVENPDHRESGCRSMTLNGQELPDNYIPEELLAEKNEIVLIM